VCLVSRNILVVGVADKGSALRELPVRVLMLDTGAQAIRCLKEEKIDTVISHWELIDMVAGQLLTNVTAAKPFTPTIAFIKPGDTDQEIDARGLGVDAVLSEDIDDDYFRDTVCQLLGISAVESIHLVDDDKWRIGQPALAEDYRNRRLSRF
jgi:response regulator RpfG family c-di-GMP phosphodiesterase